MEPVMKLLAAAVTVNTLSLISNIVGVAIPYWAYASQDDATAVRGLWHQCDIRQDAESMFCFAAYDTVPAYVHSVRALEIVGIVLLSVTLVLGVLRMLVYKENLAKYAAGFGFASGFLIVLGIIIFAAKFVEESNAITEMHYGLSVGFGLCVASGVLSFVTGILYIASSFRRRRH